MTHFLICNYGTSFQFMPQYFLTTVIQIFLFFWFEFYNWVIISLGFAACRTNIPQRSVFFYLWMRREIRHRSMLIYVKLKIQTQSISRIYFYFIHSSLFINWNKLCLFLFYALKIYLESSMNYALELNEFWISCVIWWKSYIAYLNQTID